VLLEASLALSTFSWEPVGDSLRGLVLATETKMAVIPPLLKVSRNPHAKNVHHI
jgi:hypothetical protein